MSARTVSGARPTTRHSTLLGVPAVAGGQLPDLTNVEQNTPRFSRYKTVEASMVKRQGNRWSAQVGGSYTWSNDFPGDYPNDAERPVRRDRPRAGTSRCRARYEAPWGIRVSPLVRHQAGQNFARQISVGSAAATAVGAIFTGHHLRRGA